MGMGEPLAPPVPQLHASAHHGALSLSPQVGEPLAYGARHPYVLSHPVDRSRRAVQRLAGLCQSPAADGREPTAVHCRRPLNRAHDGIGLASEMARRLTGLTGETREPTTNEVVVRYAACTPTGCLVMV